MNKNLDEIVEYRGVTDLVIAEVLTTSNSSESKYYNNMAAIVINSTGADEIKCSVSVIPQDKLAFITGQDYDEEPGNYYLISRYYNPILARFISEDSY